MNWNEVDVLIKIQPKSFAVYIDAIDVQKTVTHLPKWMLTNKLLLDITWSTKENWERRIVIDGIGFKEELHGEAHYGFMIPKGVTYGGYKGKEDVLHSP
jgi:hypothetical protein